MTIKPRTLPSSRLLKKQKASPQQRVHCAGCNYQPLLCFRRLSPAGRKFPDNTRLEKSITLLPSPLQTWAPLTDTRLLCCASHAPTCPRITTLRSPGGAQDVSSTAPWGKGHHEPWDHLCEQQAHTRGSGWYK